MTVAAGYQWVKLPVPESRTINAPEITPEQHAAFIEQLKEAVKKHGVRYFQTTDDDEPCPHWTEYRTLEQGNPWRDYEYDKWTRWSR